MNKTSLILVIGALGLGWAGAAAAYPLQFPARATSLGADEYFISDGHGSSYVGKGGSTWSMDIKVSRAHGSGWSKYAAGAAAPYTLAEDAGYGTPLYAAADGVVIACWRGLPDGPDPDTNNCDGGCPPGHTLGGNHLVILTPDGDHVVYYAHLAQNSIPASLCPIADADGLIDDMSVAQCSNGYSSYRNSSRLDGFLSPAQFPVVKKGDYIGDMGHSGNSWRPHLHLQVNPFAYDDQGTPCQGTSEEIEFVEAWYQPQSSGSAPDPYAWQPLDVDPLPVTPSTGNFALWPDPIGARKADLTLGDGDSIDVEADVQGGLVAYRDPDGDLRLTSFHVGLGDLVDDGGDLTLQATRSEGGVEALDLVKLPVNERDYVLVIRGSNGKLKAIPYSVDYTTGAIARHPGEREDGPVSLIAAAPSPSHSGAVVAVKQSDGTLKVLDYVAADGSLAITRPGSSASTNQEVVDIAITPVKAAFVGAVTAEVSPYSGAVTLRSFEVTAGGDVIAADAEPGLTQVEDVALTTVDGLVFPGMSAVALTMREGSGALRVQTWSVANTGALTLLDDTGAGSVGVIDVAATGARDFVTGVRDAGGELRMISWSTDWAGDSLRRSGTAAAGGITEIDLASYHRTPAAGTGHPRYDHLLAGVRTASGALKVLSSGANYAAWY